MADYEDLEDELGQVDNDPRNMNNQLFDDDDDDEDFQPDLAQQGDVDDDDGDAFAGPAGTRQTEPAAAKPSVEPAPAPTDLKAKLAALAQKKRQEAAAAEAGGGKKKKGDKDKDKDGKGKRKRDKSGKGEKERPARPNRTPGGEQPPPRKQRPNDEDGPQGSVDSRELQAEEADKGFIDDEADNFAPEDAPSDDEDARLANALEAVEEGQDLFGRKNKRKKQESDAQMTVAIDNMIAQMEAAADMDMDNHTNNKPAFSKLKMLKEVEGFVAQRKYHELFIHSGGLGVLKAWLEPYSDGTLPNVRVRSAVLNSCKILPIDTGREDIKENLKKSQLGSRIMFLANCPDETQANRKVAIELVQNWSRPIFFDAEAEAEKKRAREESLRRARAATIEQHRAKEEQKQAEQDAKNKIKYGQQGYRWHAVIPQPVKLDYVTAPQQESAVSQAAAGMQAGAKKDEDRFSKKMREVVRKQKGSTARGGVVSVEGRGMII